jgi:hypothetical protein
VSYETKSKSVSIRLRAFSTTLNIAGPLKALEESLALGIITKLHILDHTNNVLLFGTSISQRVQMRRCWWELSLAGLRARNGSDSQSETDDVPPFLPYKIKIL